MKSKVSLGELCTYSKGIGIPREYTDVNLDIPYLHYGDIYKKYDFRINLDKELNEIIKISKNEKIKTDHFLSDGDIVYTLTSETVDDLGHSTLIINEKNYPFVAGMETTVIRIKDKNKILPAYLNYIFQSESFRRELRQFVTGMKVYRVHPTDLLKIKIDIPSLEDQLKIVSFLDSISNKIQINIVLNDYLAQISKQYFNQYVENCTDYSEKSLTDIANYQNGLAMQKFRPTDNSNFLPVLKIRELSMGCCNQDSDKCTPDIKKECIVEDGDIIFSWSGSLMIDIWCGGKCGLNQHLFKVTSDSYPAWFIFYWTDYYMDNFREIAGDKATTMGHICRNHLEESIVKCPNNVTFESIDSIMGPLFEKRISLMKENRMLISIRNELLPKLMSGEIDVSKIDLSN